MISTIGFMTCTKSSILVNSINVGIKSHFYSSSVAHSSYGALKSFDHRVATGQSCHIID